MFMRLDASSEVGGDLLLVAALRVHDVPLTGLGPGVVDDLGCLFGGLGLAGQVEAGVDGIVGVADCVGDGRVGCFVGADLVGRSSS
jgi:hypothetical protein